MLSRLRDRQPLAGKQGSKGILRLQWLVGMSLLEVLEHLNGAYRVISTQSTRVLTLAVLVLIKQSESLDLRGGEALALLDVFDRVLWHAFASVVLGVA